MTSILSTLSILASTLYLAGCAIEQPTVTHIGSVRALVTPADVRIITERAQPTRTTPLLCAEPSPDISKALSTLAKASGGTGTVQAGVGVSTAESISILAGRTAGVVALRDGLFRACEAYANGIIGPRSYALILSQYGNLLVTLMLAEDASGSGGIGAATRGPSAAATDLDLKLQSATAPSTAAATAPVAPAETAPAGSGALNLLQPSGAASAGTTAVAATDDSFGKNASTDSASAPAADKTPTKDVTTPDAAKSVTSSTDTATTTAPATSPSGGPQAVQTIAKMYFDSAPVRSKEAEFTACVSDRPDVVTEQNEKFRPFSSERMVNKYCENFLNEQTFSDAEVAGEQLKTARAQTTKALADASAAEASAYIAKLQIPVAEKAAKDAIAKQTPVALNGKKAVFPVDTKKSMKTRSSTVTH